MDFRCPHCGWQGKGTELINGFFSEENLTDDLECPKCMNTIAFWQAPLVDKTKAYRNSQNE